jgi:ribonuclease E
VPLASGGSIVIDSTEALVAIDVNSGRFRKVSNAEETAYQINMEAADEIARQLRLRDLGGLIVCDFIDMRLDRHKRAVEKTLRDQLKKHKERAHVLRMSQFGLIELTRQRQGPPIKLGVYADCTHCRGTGLVMTTESVTLQVVRSLQLLAQRRDLDLIELTVSSEVASDLQNRKRAVLHRLETETGKRIVVLTNASFAGDQMECTGQDRTGRRFRIALEPQPAHAGR